MAMALASGSSLGILPGRVSLRPDHVSVSQVFNRKPATPCLKVSRTLHIRCARVAGVEIPNNKRIETSLRYIHGVGLTTSRKILRDTGIYNKRTKDLTEEELTKLRDELGNYMIENDLRRFVQNNIQMHIDNKTYRGLRHAAGLPVRGQRTKTNARTRKGKKRLPVPGKKKAK